MLLSRQLGNHCVIRSIAEEYNRQWWPHKEKIVKAWTSQILHYGTKTTSPGESAHSALKTWLQTSRNDVYTFFQKLGPFYDGEIDRYNATLAQAQLRAPTELLRKESFRDIIRIISVPGLRHFQTQLRYTHKLQRKRQNNPSMRIEPCTGRFTRQIGVPCQHTILYKYLQSPMPRPF